MMHDNIILGAGIGGLSLASLLDEPSLILEKEETAGGLCRSFDFQGIHYDIGPHIIFSKHKEVLDLHNSMVDVRFHERLNRILVSNKYVKYPFENHLGQLPDSNREACLSEFLSNPYKSVEASNMQQFFLSKFGEGMTDLYFAPYNKKIWKFDTSALDLQMVERIPDPPVEDIVNGAKGEFKEGYTHQLQFSYPSEGGFQTIVDEYLKRAISLGTQVKLNECVVKIAQDNDVWHVQTNTQIFTTRRLISTIPLPNLIQLLPDVPQSVIDTSEELKFNSIHIVMLQFKKDRLIDQFALYIPDSEVIFHRLTRLNFLGEAYGGNSDVFNVMLEVTFRPGSYLSTLSSEDILERCLQGLEKLEIANREELLASEVRTFDHAYVIYDLNHRKNVDTLLRYVSSRGIICHGRFGKFEYQNSDQVVKDSMDLAKQINDKN
jgi:protoporphyrinogen oxidase